MGEGWDGGDKGFMVHPHPDPPPSPQGEGILGRVINQSIIIWTPKTKSLLPSLYKREEFPLFSKEGGGEILEKDVWSIMDSLVTVRSLG